MIFAALVSRAAGRRGLRAGLPDRHADRAAARWPRWPGVLAAIWPGAARGQARRAARRWRTSSGPAATAPPSLGWPRPCRRPTAPPPSSPSACSPATSARSRGRSRWWRTTTPRAGRSSARSIRRPARRPWSGFTGPPGVGKSTLIGRLVEHARARDREVAVLSIDPQLAVHPRRPARRPHPAVRPLPRPRRVHPLDGQPRLARRAVRGHAPGRAADGRLRARTTCSSRPWAWARPRWTSSTTPTRSCSC